MTVSADYHLQCHPFYVNRWDFNLSLYEIKKKIPYFNFTRNVRILMTKKVLLKMMECLEVGRLFLLVTI